MTTNRKYTAEFKQDALRYADEHPDLTNHEFAVMIYFTIQRISKHAQITNA